MNNNCAIPFERNTTMWSKSMRNVPFVYFKEYHIYQVSRKSGGGAILAIMHALDGSDGKNKADDTVTGNKGHSTASYDTTHSLYDIRQCASDCGNLICGFGQFIPDHYDEEVQK